MDKCYQLLITSLDEVEEARFDIFAFLKEGHVGHIAEQETLGATRQEGLGDGQLDGDARVVLAVDEVDGYVDTRQGGIGPEGL